MIEAALVNDVYILLVLNNILSFTLIYIFWKIIFLCALLITNKYYKRINSFNIKKIKIKKKKKHVESFIIKK